MGSKIYDIGKSELQKIVDESNSYAEVFEKLGMCKHGSNYNTLRKVIEQLEIDLTQINKNRKSENYKQIKHLHKTHEIPLEDILSGKYKKEYQGWRLKNKLIKAGYKTWKCECCGNTEWLNNPIPLNLHHKDGNHTNNQLDNLELLCPNCHSLTDTFAGKNIKNKNKELNI